MMKEVDHFRQEECVGMTESASFRFLRFVSSAPEPHRYVPVNWSRVPVMWGGSHQRRGTASRPCRWSPGARVGPLWTERAASSVGRVGLTYFLDQTGEVPQAGDRHGRLAIEHRDVFTGTA